MQSEKLVLFGYFEIISGKYYSFCPQHMLKNNRFVSTQYMDDIFPRGKINLFFNSYIREETCPYYNKEIGILTLTKDDLEQFEDKSGVTRVKAESIDINNAIFPSDKYKLYPVVVAKSSNIDFANDKNIFIEESFITNKYTKYALLYYNTEYYGPFEVCTREKDNALYLKNNTPNNNYIVSKYSSQSDEDPILDCGHYDESVEFIHLNETFEKESVDVMPDTKILEMFESCIQNITDEDDKRLLLKIPQLIEKFNNEISTNTPNLTNARITRLKKALKNVNQFGEYVNIIADSIQTLLSKQESHQTQMWQKEILEKTDLLQKIQNYRIVKEQIQELKNEKDIITQQIEDLKNTPNIEQNETASIDTIKINEEIKEKQLELDNICNKLNLAQDIEELEKKVKEEERKADDWVAKRKEIEKNIQNKIQDLKDKVEQINFESEFNKMIQDKFAEDFYLRRKEEEHRKYAQFLKDEKELLSRERKIDDITNYLVLETQKYRPLYSRNEILNIYINVTQNLLTVFAGEPGTGKTSICKIIAHILGIDKEIGKTEKIKRFATVQVERGWNSKRDFIGYYNPLSQQVERNNEQIYDILNIANIEMSKSNTPNIILLDEANLSPMEYYWSDFIGITDNESNNESYINLGAKEKFYIPKTLRFVATINSDHTVEKMSPRLIDRVPIISLPTNAYQSKITPLKDSDYDSVISFDLIKKTFDNGNMVISKTMQDTILECKSKLKELNIFIEPRTEQYLLKYIATAQNMFEDEGIIDKSIVALDYALLQRVITKISGTGSQYKEALENFKKYCIDNNLLKCFNKIDVILKSGESDFVSSFEYFN